MKKQLLALVVLIVAGASVATAQGGGRGPRKTVEERVQVVHHLLDSALKIDAAVLTKTDSVFATYYRATDKKREEIMSEGGERPDFQAMREKMQPMIDARDKELKVLLGDPNFKKWKEELEPGLMPRRGQGRSGN